MIKKSDLSGKGYKVVILNRLMGELVSIWPVWKEGDREYEQWNLGNGESIVVGTSIGAMDYSENGIEIDGVNKVILMGPGSFEKNKSKENEMSRRAERIKKIFNIGLNKTASTMQFNNGTIVCYDFKISKDQEDIRTKYIKIPYKGELYTIANTAWIYFNSRGLVADIHLLIQSHSGLDEEVRRGLTDEADRKYKISERAEKDFQENGQKALEQMRQYHDKRLKDSLDIEKDVQTRRERKETMDAIWPETSTYRPKRVIPEGFWD